VRIASDLLMGMAPGARALIDVSGGGRIEARGAVRIGGSAGGHGATAVMETMCVGGSPLCGTSPGVAGRLTVEADGRLEGGTLLLAQTGRMNGAGTVAVAETLLFGVVEPGTDPGGEAGGGGLGLEQRALAAPASTTSKGHRPVDPAVLTFQGDVVLGPTAELVIDIWGGDPSLHDRIVVDGALQLGGTLVLNFIHHAPRQGDVLGFITASGVVDGAFTEVVVQGLGPGFRYEIDVVDGELRLTALNNASLGVIAPVGSVTAIPTLGTLGLLLLTLGTVLMAGRTWRRRNRPGGLH